MSAPDNKLELKVDNFKRKYRSWLDEAPEEFKLYKGWLDRAPSDLCALLKLEEIRREKYKSWLAQVPTDVISYKEWLARAPRDNYAYRLHPEVVEIDECEIEKQFREVFEKWESNLNLPDKERFSKELAEWLNQAPDDNFLEEDVFHYWLERAPNWMISENFVKPSVSNVHTDDQVVTPVTLGKRKKKDPKPSVSEAHTDVGVMTRSMVSKLRKMDQTPSVSDPRIKTRRMLDCVFGLVTNNLKHFSTSDLYYITFCEDFPRMPIPCYVTFEMRADEQGMSSKEIFTKRHNEEMAKKLKDPKMYRWWLELILELWKESVRLKKAIR